jgi:DNA polymerase III subunit delta'
MAFQIDAAFELLRRAHLQNRLGHAYLISGPAGSGKRRLAADLASLVSGIDRDNIFSTTTQSVLLAEPESKSRRIVVEQVRQLEHALQMRAAGGQRKVVIIAEADRLQPQAANAFLKTLEEPPRDSLLLLLSALPEALPDTIVSRCIAISLAGGEDRQSLPETAELIELLQQSAAEKGSNIRSAFRLAQEFQALLRNVREQIKAETDEALKREEARYRTIGSNITRHSAKVVISSGAPV